MSFRFHHSQKEDQRWKSSQVLHLAREKEGLLRGSSQTWWNSRTIAFPPLHQHQCNFIHKKTVTLLRVNTAHIWSTTTRRENKPGFEFKGKRAFKTRKKLDDRGRISIMNQQDKLKKQKQRFQNIGNVVFSHWFFSFRKSMALKYWSMIVSIY